jgi:hypothetical protein
MEVRVVREQPPETYGETDYVRVHTYHDPANDTVTLATIERVVDKTGDVAQRVKPTLRVKTLIMRQPMSENAALTLATSYAQRKKIPVVYAEQNAEQADEHGRSN